MSSPSNNPYSSPTPTSTLAAASSLAQRTPFYYGWVNVVLGALAMLATLPGRTHGLGLVTEPLLKDLHLDRSQFAQVNLWATLIGGLFCIPIGRLIDRWGTRLMAVIVVAALGFTVWGLSAVQGIVGLLILVTLTRGFGQSALSVVSIAMVGKWFHRRISLAMGAYSVLMGILFSLAFGLVGKAVHEQGWRTAQWEIAMALLVVYLPLAALLVRSTPEACGVTPDEPLAEPAAAPAASTTSFHLFQALQTPAFWVFALATSIYGLASSGLGLFNQAVLAERGFDAKTYYDTLVLSSMVSLVGQLAAGWLGWVWSLRGLMSAAMFLYAGSLLWLPHIETLAEVRGYAVIMGFAGGIVAVVFFAIWGELFGRAHLGRIQGAAQMLTVLSSAVGPLLFAECYARTGSYCPAFYAIAPVVIVLGVAAWLVPAPSRRVENLRVEPATS